MGCYFSDVGICGGVSFALHFASNSWVRSALCNTKTSETLPSFGFMGFI